MKTITYNNETKTIKQWADLTGLRLVRIYARLAAGWPVEKILSTELRGYRKGRFRKEAKARGELVYEGKPHKKCGLTVRYTSSGECINCIGERASK